MKRLHNKVAVITGGNSGIGKGIAQHFFQEGARVVIFGRNPDTLKQAEQEMGNKILAIQGDVTKTADLIQLYEKTIAHFGKIDILIANSGVGERMHPTEVNEDRFDNMVDINYRGAFFTIKYALDHMNEKSSIILIASCAAHVSVKNHSIYSSTKAAVIKLAQNLSTDLAEKSIRVNSISPGYIETPIFDNRLSSDPDYLIKRKSYIPLKRIGTVQDIAHAALFLSSEAASYITGADLRIDGGLSASAHEPL